MTTNKATPIKSSAIYRAASHINAVGLCDAADLFAAVDFGAKHSRQGKLEHAFDIEWLRLAESGAIGLTEHSRRHFADQEPKEVYIGQITPAPSWNVYERPPLSRKNIPNRRGMRRDIPDWSHRAAGFAFKSVAGGDS